MAPSRSKKSKYRKTPRGKAVSPHKEEESMSKTKQRKRKLSDMLGPQWSKEELERFYEGYRKFGKEWKKVAAFVHSRSTEMVEALYTMNKAYLSLPEVPIQITSSARIKCVYVQILRNNIVVQKVKGSNLILILLNKDIFNN